jgi:RNA polymerase sigma-70 factor, ECF subfamily
MNPNQTDEDQLLVRLCLSQSRQAWDEFYVRFLPLVRRAVEKHAFVRMSDREDIVQDVFVSVHADLHKYDSRYKLSQFIWIVTKQVCVDHYRRAKAAKRDAWTVPVEHHDGSEDGYAMLRSLLNPQDQQLEAVEQSEILKAAFTELGEKCRDLLRLRFFEELSFKEIASILGANKKSLAVQAGRCIDQLRELFADTERMGLRS